MVVVGKLVVELVEAVVLGLETGVIFGTDKAEVVVAPQAASDIANASRMAGL